MHPKPLTAGPATGTRTTPATAAGPKHPAPMANARAGHIRLSAPAHTTPLALWGRALAARPEARQGHNSQGIPMHKILLPAFALLTALLTGCAASPDLPPDFSLSRTEPDMGLAIASLTLSGVAPAAIDSLEFELRPRPGRYDDTAVARTTRFASPMQHAQAAARPQDGDSPTTYRLVVKDANSSLPMEIAGPAGQGRLAALRLPPGDYELYAWRLRQSTRDGFVETRPERSLAYPFTVEPGATTYIGRINLDLRGQAARLSVADQRQLDLQLLAGKYPRVRIDSFQVTPWPAATPAR